VPFTAPPVNGAEEICCVEVQSKSGVADAGSEMPPDDSLRGPPSAARDGSRQVTFLWQCHNSGVRMYA